MIRTRVGYAGGTKSHPTYHDLGDHSEAIEIDFDPDVLSFAQLLDVFWAAHDPRRGTGSRQYRSAVFAHGDEQFREATASRGRREARLGKLVTPIERAGVFTRAEDYHQKYYLRSARTVGSQMEGLFEDSTRFTDSTAVARLNGYLGGHGSAADMAAVLATLPLDGAGRDRVLELMRKAAGDS